MRAKISDITAVHPMAEIFPMISGPEISELGKDIKDNGLAVPIVLYNGVLLDGRNRVAACKLEGIEEVEYKEYEGDSPTSFVISCNLKRRHLSSADRAILSAAAVEHFEAEAKKKMLSTLKQGDHIPGSVKATLAGKQDSSNRSTAKAAKQTGAGRSATVAVLKIKEEAKDVYDLLKNGKIKTISDAKKMSQLDSERRAEVAEFLNTGLSMTDAISEIQTPSELVASAIESISKKSNQFLSATRKAIKEINDNASFLKRSETEKIVKVLSSISCAYDVYANDLKCKFVTHSDRKNHEGGDDAIY